jgi:hypothetical protein
VVYVALALGKEIYSDLPEDELRRLLPIQNSGRSAANIAQECLALFGQYPAHASEQAIEELLAIPEGAVA